MRSHSPATLYVLAVGLLLVIASFVWPPRFSFTIPVHHEIAEISRESGPDSEMRSIDFAGGTVVHLNLVHLTLLASGCVFLGVGAARWFMERKPA